MTGIFRAANPSGNLLLLFYALLVKFPLLLNPAKVVLLPGDGILYRLPITWLGQIFPPQSYLWSLLSFGACYVQALMLNRASNMHRLHQQPNRLTGMTFLLFTSLLPEFMQVSALLFVNFLLIILWNGLSQLDNHRAPRTAVFNLGLAIGVAAFFYFPAVVFVLLLITGTAIMRPFRIQEWLIALAGALTPAYFYAAWLFLNERITDYRVPEFFPRVPFFGKEAPLFAAAGFALLLFSGGIFFVNKYISRQVVHTRKIWQLLFVFFLVAAGLVFINGHRVSLLPAAIGIAPAAAAFFFYPKRRIWVDLLHAGGIGLIIWGNFA